MKRLVLAAIVATCVGCADETLPPLPESLIVVDTNVAVPSAVSRLRVDVFTSEGTWFDSRDFALPDARDWPASFTVFSGDDARDRDVWVRLRAYPDGRVRDYRGERRIDWSAPFKVPEGTGEPRLLRNGVDETPTSEPEPLVSIDRLVHVRLKVDTSDATKVVLDGACVGTMSTIEEIASGAATSCVDQAKERAPVELSPSMTRSVRSDPSVNGTWLATSCGDLPEDRVCVLGGATLLGASDQVGSSGTGADKAAIPVRLFGVRTFAIDRTEVTVGKMRDAIADGFDGDPPLVNDAAIAAPRGIDDTGACNYTSTARDREDQAVTCVKHAVARAFCQRLGGDLPTEIQWEHAATVAGRPAKTRFPWGNDDPSCDRARTGRAMPDGRDAPCKGLPLGPGDVTEHPEDVTPFGALNLGGGVAEWMRDTYQEYASSCWGSAPIVDPSCDQPRDARSWRGSSWMSPLAWSTYRLGLSSDAALAFLGFRCVYEVGE